MITIDFNDDGSPLSFIRLAKQFNTDFTENYFSIHPDIGSGIIMKADLGDGMIIYLWDITLSFDMQLKRFHEKIAEDSYCISFFLEPTDLKFRFGFQPAYKTADVSHYCFVLSGKANIDLLVDRNTRCRYITLVVPTSMMTADIKRELRNQVQRHHLGFRFFALRFEEYKVVLSLFDMMRSNESLIHLKLQASVIFDALINNIHFLKSTRLKKISLDQNKMLNIEKRIIENVESNIPSLSRLADEMEMSESSVKRHFKIIFGKSIYQYYLEKKMQHARLLLLNKHMNVSEVSAKLGYEKTSHFIKMFKKHIGYLPGKLKK